MISRYEVYLNDIALSKVHPDILILDIQHQPAQIRNTMYNVANRQGANVNKRYIDRASVVVTFEIHNYNIAQRQAIRDEIVKWAKDGGVLRTNDRIHQRLRCICETFPAVTSAKNWTDPLQIVFTAYDLPFWESLMPVELTLTGTTGSGTMYVPGTYGSALVEVTITANADITSVDLTVNGRTLTLSDLTVASGSKIRIRYDGRMIQSIKRGSTSLLKKRSGVDDLLADCGASNSFEFTASASVDVTFSVRGLWL